MPTCKGSNMLISIVFIYHTVKSSIRKKLGELSKNILALIHRFKFLTKLKPKISIQIVTQLKSSTISIYKGFHRTHINLKWTLVIIYNY